jgi:cytochrome c biogenesis protein CcmG/thiol:disulfide interchange protein DsbE
MNPRFARLALLAVLLLALAVAGCGSETEQSGMTADQVMPDLTGADPRLQELSLHADELLPGGKPAFEKQLRELRGLPVVVNKWASWCGPCKAEAPILQETARDFGDRVAFLGVNVDDSVSGAEKFSKRWPMPYPSFVDPDARISQLFKPAPARRPPSTAFYDARGRLQFVAIGQLQSVRQLKELIERYAGPIPPEPAK